MKHGCDATEWEYSLFSDVAPSFIVFLPIGDYCREKPSFQPRVVKRRIPNEHLVGFDRSVSAG